MKSGILLIQNFFERIFYFFHSHHKLTIFLSIVVYLVSFVGSLNLKQAVTITDQMDQEAQSTQDIIHVNASFSQNSSLGLIVLKNDKSFFSAKEVCQIQLDINQLLYSKGYVDSFNSPFKMRVASLDQNILTYKRILPNPCELEANNIYSLQALHESPWGKLLTGNDLKDLVYNFTFTNIEVPTKYGHFDPDRVVDFMKSVEGKIKAKIYWTGPEAMQYYTVEGLNHSQWLNLLLIFIIWGGLRIYFGTLRAGAIYLGSLAFTVTVIFGGMGVMGHQVDMLSSCLFLLLAISSLQDFIFVAQHQLQSHDNYIQSHLKLITPSFFTSLTTILGFASLMISNLTSIKVFGGWAAFGALLEWVVVFWLIPAFMKAFPSWQSWVNKEKALSLKKTNTIAVLKIPRILSRLLLIFFIGAIYSIKHFRLSQTPSEMFPKGHPYQQMIKYVRHNRGWESEASLVFAKNFNETTKKEIIEKLKDEAIVAEIETYPAVLEYAQKEIKDPMTRKLVKDELELSRFTERYINEQKEERAFIYLNTTNTDKINNLRDKINLLCPERECYLTGEIVGFADFSKELINTLFESLFISLALVTATIWFLAYLFKSKNFFNMIISSFWGPAVLLCLIYVFDISINFVTCIVASTLVGLTGDNAIQFLFAAKDDDFDSGIHARGASSLYCSLTMALCSLVFLGSYFDAPKDLGLMLAAGFILSYIGDVWLLKSLSDKNGRLL